jgi:FkbM family methyltransferase
MLDNIENRDGIWWPKAEVACYKWTNKQLDVPHAIMEYVNNKDVIVQAGGNAGWYTQLYAKNFKQVYVLEPDYLNFVCLTLNNPGPNVIKIQSCLGNKHEQVNVSYSETDRGRNHITTTDPNFTANVPVLTIDDLSLQQCNLIHLDIEGFEYFAFQGAIKTIEKFKPIIAFEHNGLHSRYNVDETEFFNFFKNLGYKQIGQHKDELIFGV